MIIKNRLAAAALAACLTVGGGIAVAAPAQAYEMVKQQIIIKKSGYSTKTYCEYKASMTDRQYTAAGWTGIGGEDCLYSSTQKWGFSLVFIKWVPKAS